MKFCPYTLLNLCRDCGVRLKREGETLVALSDRPLMREMRDALRRHKPELLAILPESEP